MFGPSFTEGGAYQLNPLERLQPPSIAHPFGTDHLGRDVLARVAAGARTTLLATFLIVGGALVISIAVGLIAGLSGRIVDTILMRLIDVVLAIPDLVIALAVLGILGPGFGNLLLALTVASWAYLGRLARIHVVQSRDRPDIWADQLAGVSTARIVAGHILPHLVAQLSVVATLRVGGVVMSFAGLSFLGLGAEPGSAEWGAQLAEARIYMFQAPWMVIAPAGCILWTIAATNLCADALRDGSKA
ncbi:MAG: ABC transporter permease [Pseudomonadota bacterium]